MNKIKDDDSVDDMFRLNCTLLIMSLLGEGITCGTINCRFLPCIDNVDDIPKMDWCGYVVDCLIRSKSEWKTNPSANWFTGPLCFLALWYAETVTNRGETGIRKEMALEYWTSEKLKDLEKKMILSGGFEKKNLRRSGLKVLNQVAKRLHK